MDGISDDSIFVKLHFYKALRIWIWIWILAITFGISLWIEFAEIFLSNVLNFK